MEPTDAERIASMRRVFATLANIMPLPWRAGLADPSEIQDARYSTIAHLPYNDAAVIVDAVNSLDDAERVIARWQRGWQMAIEFAREENTAAIEAMAMGMLSLEGIPPRET